MSKPAALKVMPRPPDRPPEREAIARVIAHNAALAGRKRQIEGAREAIIHLIVDAREAAAAAASAIKAAEDGAGERLAGKMIGEPAGDAPDIDALRAAVARADTDLAAKRSARASLDEQHAAVVRELAAADAFSLAPAVRAAVAADPAVASLATRCAAAEIEAERLRRACDVLGVAPPSIDWPADIDDLAARCAAWLSKLRTDADASLE